MPEVRIIEGLPALSEVEGGNNIGEILPPRV